MKNQALSPRQTRWAQWLATFNFKIIHIKGTENQRTDALSRRPNLQGKAKVSGALLQFAKDGTIVYNALKLAATTETGANKWLKWIQKETAASDKDMSHLPKGSMFTNEVYKVFNRTFVPAKIQREFVRRFHEAPAHGHQRIKRTLERLIRDYYFPRAQQIVTEVLRDCTNCHRNKPERHAPYGHLQPVEVPERP